ncbi:hypothetical protein AGLY_015883 [Aphis glycines]|uniref:Uncharacterized protein n=1 Tax=Aphis glycines TaxID=307491 RepID=A0A6G0SZY9_APHGL|nr:hypothetical protein AGLY_015883 [Aphis glycines]
MMINSQIEYEYLLQKLISCIICCISLLRSTFKSLTNNTFTQQHLKCILCRTGYSEEMAKNKKKAVVAFRITQCLFFLQTHLFVLHFFGIIALKNPCPVPIDLDFNDENIFYFNSLFKNEYYNNLCDWMLKKYSKYRIEYFKKKVSKKHLEYLKSILDIYKKEEIQFLIHCNIQKKSRGAEVKNRSIFTAPNVVDRHKKKKTHIIVKSIHSSLCSESKNFAITKLRVSQYLLKYLKFFNAFLKIYQTILYPIDHNIYNNNLNHFDLQYNVLGFLLHIVTEDIQWLVKKVVYVLMARIYQNLSSFIIIVSQTNGKSCIKFSTPSYLYKIFYEFT